MPETLKIERLGGLAGFGLPGGRLRSTGQLDLSSLPADVRSLIEELFVQPPAQEPSPDSFRYRLTRNTPSGDQTVEVPESAVPDEVSSAVKDELL